MLLNSPLAGCGCIQSAFDVEMHYTSMLLLTFYAMRMLSLDVVYSKCYTYFNVNIVLYLKSEYFHIGWLPHLILAGNFFYTSFF